MTDVLVNKNQLEAAMQILSAWADSQGVAQKNVASNTAQYGHGPGGTFSLPQLDPTIYNAMTLPVQGLAVRLPVMKTNYTTPLYGIVTGQTATTGSEPSGPCGDWPEAGLTQLCANWAPLSTEGRSSRKIDLTRIGAFNDRSDFREFQFIGDAFKPAGVQAGDRMPDELSALTGGNGNFLNNEIAKQYRELQVALLRDFAVDTYTGNPANNVGNGGGREYFKGLDVLINTGYKDAVTGITCNASDSIIESFGGQLITNAGSTLVLLVDSVIYRLNAVAELTGTNPVQFAFVMKRSLFHEMTEVWPCSYLTTRCTLTGNATDFVDAQAAIAMRDEMRNGNFLYVAGVKYPVIIDDACTETNLGNGQFSSTIYVVPLTVVGGVPATYWEYFDFNGPFAAGSVIKAVPALFGSAVVGDGKYLMTVQKQADCFSVSLKARRRLLLRTPYLAARITNVVYQPIRGPERSPFTTSPYFVNGGVSQQITPSYFYPSTVA